MPDYKRMYYHMLHVTEDVINALIAAQNKAEEIYIESSASDEDITLQFVEDADDPSTKPRE